MSAYAKRGVSQSMYDRGSAFAAAALLLRRHANSEAHDYAVLNGQRGRANQCAPLD